MGCLFSKKKELTESEGKGASPAREMKETKVAAGRPDIYIDTEAPPSKSPRPQMPSPYQHVEIDPVKKSQVGQFYHPNH